MHALRHPPAQLQIVQVLDRPHPVLDQRRVEEFGPTLQVPHHLVRQIAEPPLLERMPRLVVIMVTHRLEQADHATDEMRRKNADGAEIQQVDATGILAIGLADQVVAQMRVAMDDAEFVQRLVIRLEQPGGVDVTLLQRRVFLDAAHQRPAGQPGHGQQALRRQLHHRHGHMHQRIARQHDAV